MQSSQGLFESKTCIWFDYASHMAIKKNKKHKFERTVIWITWSVSKSMTAHKTRENIKMSNIISKCFIVGMRVFQLVISCNHHRAMSPQPGAMKALTDLRSTWDNLLVCQSSCTYIYKKSRNNTKKNEQLRFTLDVRLYADHTHSLCLLFN